jgi:hypothetical protein
MRKRGAKKGYNPKILQCLWCIPYQLNMHHIIGLFDFLKGFIALININHTCELQNCSSINQFTAVSLQLHVGEFDLAKITALKTITQYTKTLQPLGGIATEDV